MSLLDVFINRTYSFRTGLPQDRYVHRRNVHIFLRPLPRTMVHYIPYGMIIRNVINEIFIIIIIIVVPIADTVVHYDNRDISVAY